MNDVSSPTAATATTRRQAQRQALLDALVPLANEMSCLNHRRRCVERIARRAHNTKAALRVDAAASYASGVRQLERSDGRIAAARRSAEERRAEEAEDRRAALEDRHSKHRAATPSVPRQRRGPATVPSGSESANSSGSPRQPDARRRVLARPASITPPTTSSETHAAPGAAGGGGGADEDGGCSRPARRDLGALRALVAKLASQEAEGGGRISDQRQRQQPRDVTAPCRPKAAASDESAATKKQQCPEAGPRYMRAKEHGPFDERAARLAKLDARRTEALRAVRYAANEDRVDALKGRRDRQAAWECRLEDARAAQHERRSLLRSRTPGLDPPLVPRAF